MNFVGIAIFISLVTAVLIWKLATLLVTFNRRRNLAKVLDVYGAQTVKSLESAKISSQGFRTKVIELIRKSLYGQWLATVASRSGMWEEGKVDEQIWRKCQLLVATLCLGALGTRNPEISKTLFLFIAPVFAFFIPDLLLFNRSRKRVAAIESALPETIDLLSMCVNSGLGFQAGMQRVAQTQSNPLSEEFNRLLSEMRLGEGRAQAFQRMSERLNIEPLRQFVNSVLQVDRLGIPIAKVLDDQSERIRALRHESAREQAQKVPVKILAPIMLFLMPAVFIIVLGPAAVTVIRSFSP